MKKYTAIATTVVFSLVSSVALATTITNEFYFELRRRLRKEDVSDFKAQKICDRVKGDSVDLTGKVIAVRKSGVIRVDMDGDDLFSIPDIDLSLSNKNDAENVRENSWVSFTGYVTECNFNKTTGSLTFEVSDGNIKK